nr:uncharacterized protein LOC112544516 [Pelodiscus sinensis]|eukprot:XP_025036582.1 uncharacterized protein LOC112544516 [Pelodiscus sinensis]
MLQFLVCLCVVVAEFDKSSTIEEWMKAYAVQGNVTDCLVCSLPVRHAGEPPFFVTPIYLNFLSSYPNWYANMTLFSFPTRAATLSSLLLTLPYTTDLPHAQFCVDLSGVPCDVQQNARFQIGPPIDVGFQHNCAFYMNISSIFNSTNHNVTKDWYNSTNNVFGWNLTSVLYYDEDWEIDLDVTPTPVPYPLLFINQNCVCQVETNRNKNGSLRITPFFSLHGTNIALVDANEGSDPWCSDYPRLQLLYPGHFWLCGSRAHSRLPTNAKGRCTFGYVTIQGGGIYV